MTYKVVKQAFQQVLREALEHIHEPIWLASNSILASAYFLSRTVQSKGNGNIRLGETLQQLLIESYKTLWLEEILPDYDSLIAEVTSKNRTNRVYHFFLLEMRFFRQIKSPKEPPLAKDHYSIRLELNSLKKSTYYDHLNDAINTLAQIILKRVQTTFRPELHRPPSNFSGRLMALAQCRGSIQAKRTVVLSGSGGVGKTAIAANLYENWHSSKLWITIRPFVNDSLTSIFFILGDHFQQAGQSALWLQLQANKGRIENLAELIGLLRDDLERLFAGELLIVIDEFDRLQPVVDEPIRQTHAQLLEFFEELNEITPMLLVGQRAVIDTERYVEIKPFTIAETNQLFSKLETNISSDVIETIHNSAGGNPRRLLLCHTMIESGESPDMFHALGNAQGTEALFYRLWRRLSVREQELLSALSVFRQTAPADHFSESQIVLDALVERNLIQRDSLNGVVVHEFFRLLVARQLPANTRKSYHELAAQAYLVRGQHTDALYHLHQAGQTEKVVEVWYRNRDLEISRGQAQAALVILEQIPYVSGKHSQRLDEARNQLRLLFGNVVEVNQDLSLLDQKVDGGYLTPELNRLWGQALHILGQDERALERYDIAVTQLINMSGEVARLHIRRAQLYREMQNPAAMFNMLHAVEYELARVRGLLSAMAGRLREAEKYFAEALSLSHHTNDDALIAEAHRLLAMLAGNLAEIDKAKEHAEKAINFYRKIGARPKIEGVRAELAGAYIQTKQFDRVPEPAEKALAYFRKQKNYGRVASLLTNLAESYMEIGNLEKSMNYANQALQMEHAPSVPYALYTIGCIHCREKRFKEAEESFQSGIQFATQQENDAPIPYLQRALGSCFLQQGRNSEATPLLTDALKGFSEYGIEGEIKETVALLTQAASSH